MKLLKALFSRVTFMVLMVLLQGAILYAVYRWFGEHAAWLEGILRLFAVLVVLGLVRNSVHLSQDVIWIIVILLFPVPGTVLYLLLGANTLTSPTMWRILTSTAGAAKYYRQDPEILKEAEESIPELRGQFRYLSSHAGFPLYRNTGFDYYGLGDTGYPVLLEELRKAERFIFLEYFIVEEGVMWDGILDILREKAAAGLDVRVMYDDFGSFTTLSARYAKKLEAMGIRCVPFNRVNPVLSIILNHRDHRKITVIDGRVAFSGGINLADEYINRKKRDGHWKDNIIRVTGEAVWSYTVLFLTHWNALTRGAKDEDFTVFRAEPPADGESGAADGFICPYGETPLSKEITAQNVYMNILNQANEYCWIFSPYLIIDTELINALTLAAGRGVDVRIVMPGIPDKKLVWRVTRSYYGTLIDGGVKIYEYEPGFVHSKVFVADDRCAAVGTVNLDYRSLYLHFENGTYLAGSEKILDVRRDFEETFASCREIKRQDKACRTGLVTSFLRLFAPLM